MSLSFVSNEFASIQYFWKRKKKENLMQTKEKIDGKAPQYSDCEIPVTFLKCQVYHKWEFNVWLTNTLTWKPEDASSQSALTWMARSPFWKRGEEGLTCTLGFLLAITLDSLINWESYFLTF